MNRLSSPKLATLLIVACLWRRAVDAKAAANIDGDGRGLQRYLLEAATDGDGGGGAERSTTLAAFPWLESRFSCPTCVPQTDPGGRRTDLNWTDVLVIVNTKCDGVVERIVDQRRRPLRHGGSGGIALEVRWRLATPDERFSAAVVNQCTARSGRHVVAFYEVVGDAATGVKKVIFRGTANATAVPRSADGKNQKPPHRRRNGAVAPKAAGSRLWLLYEGWHAYASDVVRAQSFAPISVEAVIRSNGGYTLDSIYQPPYSSASAAGFYYQAIPAMGPYCLYRHRAGQGAGPVADCPNISRVTTQHAEWLSGIGIDVIVFDGTNLCTDTPFADVIQLRPMEVVAEEWLELRRQGHSTPQMVAWNCIPPGATLYQKYLDNLYNNATVNELIATDPTTGKMIFFYPDSMAADPNIIAAIEGNGGRNNIIVVPMWADESPSSFLQKDMWQFMAPCQSPPGSYTTSVAEMPTCGQLVAPTTALGSTTTVSPAYQMGYSSLPFQSPGKLGTWTFRVQFTTPLTSPVDNLMISSFNEFLAQPQTNPYQGSSPYYNSMGLEWDPSKGELWVDTYGCGYGRDIEPSQECGAHTFNMLASCLRTNYLAHSGMLEAAGVLVVDANANRTDKKTTSAKKTRLPSDTAVCTTFATSLTSTTSETVIVDADGPRHVHALVGAEPCCIGGAVMYDIWVMQANSGDDMLLTKDYNEVIALSNSGQWTQVCNPIGGPTVFCTQGGGWASPLAVSGPFLLATSTAPMSGVTGFVELLRCRTSGGTHFFSTSPTCEGQTLEQHLGFVSLSRTSDFPRSLRRCYVPSTGMHYHSLDFPCQDGGSEEAMYGFVH